MASNHKHANHNRPSPTPAPTATTSTITDRAIIAKTRLLMIQEAAYYLAEKRNFAHGHHEQDWAKAERQIDAQLKARTK